MIKLSSIFKKKPLLRKKPKFTKREKKPYQTSPVKVRFVVSEDDDENSEEIQKNIAEVDGVKRVKSNHSAEDDIFDSLNGSARKESYRFEPNSKYTTIWIYGIIFIIVASLIIAAFVKGTFVSALKTFSSAISPFIVGLFIGLVLDRPIIWLDKNLFARLCKMKNNKARRILSMLLTYLILLGLVFVLFRFVIPQLAESVSELINSSQTMVDQLLELIRRIEAFIPGVDTGTIEGLIKDKSGEIVSYLGTTLAPNLLKFGISTAKLVLNLVISLIVSIYILYDKRGLKVVALRTVYSLLPISRANGFSQTINECTSIFINFVFGKSLDSLIIGMLSFIVLSIGGFPYAVLISVIIGVTNMIPYFGPFIGAIPGVIVYLCISPAKALAFIIIIFVIQQLDGLIIGPKIVGDSTGLSPLWVIVGTTVGGVYGGVVGMFLGVPIIAVLAFLLQHLVNSILNKKKIDVS